MTDYCSTFPFASPSFARSLDLRDRVLRQPLGLHFDLKDIALEWDSLHLGLFDVADQLLACLVLKPLSPQEVKMRQVAVEPHLQGKGLGRTLVVAAEREAKCRGFQKMTLHARREAVPFYLKLGYTVTSEEFEEVGIPHRIMAIDLT